MAGAGGRASGGLAGEAELTAEIEVVLHVFFTRDSWPRRVKFWEGTSVPRMSSGCWERNVWWSLLVYARRRLGLFREARKDEGRKRLAAIVMAGMKVERKKK